MNLPCRKIDRIGKRASKLEKEPTIKRFIAAESLSKIIEDLESDLYWYIKLFKVCDTLYSAMVYSVHIGCLPGFARGDRTWRYASS